MCNNCSCEDQFDLSVLDTFIASLKHQDNSALIQVLHFAQNEYGYLSVDIQKHVAKALNTPISKVYGVITFYSYFTDVPRGEFVIQVCMGTGCYVKGSQKVMDAFERKLEIKQGNTTEDMKFTLDGVRCVGACGLAPVVIINEKVYGHVTSDDVEKIVEDYLVEKLV